VLLIHASLYVLAHKWGVDGLQRLTLFKLYKTLELLPLSHANVQHIVHLARYIYSDENTPDLVRGIDEMRELVCHYIAINAEIMLEDASFVLFIEEGGAFVRDLWKVAAPRLRLPKSTAFH